MTVRPRLNKELRDEEKIRHICRAFTKRGITVRRENLTRGLAFRVRSGDCLFSGERVVFVDRRLPIEQQLMMLSDYISDYHIDLDEDEREILASS
ncbi:MAG TPA: hypothetical protein PLP17_10705 [Oligoflexia bacterium]|nr:hypothetical protein [Oligoflexia bacterium]